MSYELYFYELNSPPVLKNNLPFGFGGYLILKNNFVVGSTKMLDENMRFTNNINEAVYSADPHWKIYPKNMFHSVSGMFPITYAFTLYEYDYNHYIYYQPGNDIETINYSRLLKDYVEQSYIKHRPEPFIKNPTVQKKILKEQEKILDNYEKEFKKIQSQLERRERGAKRRILSEEEQNKLNYDKVLQKQLLDSIPVIKHNINSIKNDLKSK